MECESNCLFECCNCRQCYDESHPFYDIQEKSSNTQKLKRAKSVHELKNADISMKNFH